MQRTGVVVGGIFLAVFGAIYVYFHLNSDVAFVLPPPKDVRSLQETGQGAPPPAPPIPGAVEPAGGSPDMTEPVDGNGPPMHDPDPVPPTVLPPAGGPAGEPRIPVAAEPTSDVPAAKADHAENPSKNGLSGSKVISYFQQSKTRIDARRALGFVLLPRSAVTDAEKKVQTGFCETLLATLDFMTPGAAGARTDVLATYWPINPARGDYEITEAFVQRDCDSLIAWYDHSLARKLAQKAGVSELGGPLLITWPSASAAGDEGRDPLIVDFSKATHERAAKTLQYWFRQLKHRPELWTNRIREGTIRAELADAVNDTAGVMLAVMAGKWDSVTAVTGSP